MLPRRAGPTCEGAVSVDVPSHGMGFVSQGSSQSHMCWGTNSGVSRCGHTLGSCTLHLGLE